MPTPQLIERLPNNRARYQCSLCSNEYEGRVYDVVKRRCPDLCEQCANPLANIGDITCDTLNALLHYDELTGNVTMRRDTARQSKGSVVGYKHTQGYLAIQLNRKDYLLHRIVWLMKTGEWPEQVDHIDHNRLNNSWNNLRSIKPRENQINMSLKKSNTSGVTGVRLLPSGRFCAYIMVHRKQISLGTFDDLDDAVKARKTGEHKYGFHVNHGV